MLKIEYDRCEMIKRSIDDLVSRLSSVSERRGDFMARSDCWNVMTSVSSTELRSVANGNYEYADYIGASVGREVAKHIKYCCD